MMSAHLSQTQLAAYSERALHPDVLLEVDNHLASCDVCHERLGRIVVRGADPSVASVEGSFHLDYDQHLEPYVDGTANDIDREIVDSHVAVCSRCAGDLKDLLAFKEQQPAAAIISDARFTSNQRRQWFPSLPTPAWAAAAAVMAVFISGMAVLLWTTYPVSRIEQAGLPTGDKQTPALEHVQPSPAQEEHTVQTENGRLPGSSSERLVFSLNDAGGQLIFNRSGELEGLENLPPDLKESVERALATGRLGASPALSRWSTGAANLRSELDAQGTFAPVDPMDVVIENDRPTFRWRALEGAQHYVVTIYAKLRLVARSGQITGTGWVIPNALERGITYSWQISAAKDGETVVSPKPPLPAARFRILDQQAAVTLEKLKRLPECSHLAMGVFYWKHGMIAQSEREFQELALANPNSTVVKELLASIRSLRR